MRINFWSCRFRAPFCRGRAMMTAGDGNGGISRCGTAAQWRFGLPSADGLRQRDRQSHPADKGGSGGGAGRHLCGGVSCARVLLFGKSAVADGICSAAVLDGVWTGKMPFTSERGAVVAGGSLFRHCASDDRAVFCAGSLGRQQGLLSCELWGSGSHCRRSLQPDAVGIGPAAPPWGRCGTG